MNRTPFSFIFFIVIISACFVNYLLYVGLDMLALPANTNVTPFKTEADAKKNSGYCFSLAGYKKTDKAFYQCMGIHEF